MALVENAFDELNVDEWHDSTFPVGCCACGFAALRAADLPHGGAIALVHGLNRPGTDTELARSGSRA